MKNRIYASVLAFAFVVAGSAFGAAASTSSAPLCESVFGGTAGAASATGGGFDFGQGKWTFGAHAAYHHLFTDSIQLGGKLGFAFGDGLGSTATTAVTGTGHQVMLMVGPTFNFMNTTSGDISDAMFLFAGAGFSMAKVAGAASSTDFAFGAELGKRFKLWDNISYRPSFGFMKVGSAQVAFNVNLLNVSILY